MVQLKLKESFSPDQQYNIEAALQQLQDLGFFVHMRNRVEQEIFKNVQQRPESEAAVANTALLASWIWFNEMANNSKLITPREAVRA